MSGAILLAAGSAARFGSDKRQERGDWGQPMLHRVLGLYRPVFDHLAVVIGPDDAFGEQSCTQFDAAALVNDESRLGMGRSLAVGMGWALENGLESVVIGLADMPWISEATIRAVREAAGPHPVLPRWRGREGFPRAIPAEYFTALTQLRGDQGAGAVIDWRSAYFLDVEDPGIVQDVDRPADLDAMKGVS